MSRCSTRRRDRAEGLISVKFAASAGPTAALSATMPAPRRRLSDTDFRSRAPRFQGENLTRNLELVEALRAVAGDLNASVAQVAIAWVLSRGEDIVALIGARTRERLGEALGALELGLGDADVARIEEAMPAHAAAGERYSEQQMATLDSER